MKNAPSVAYPVGRFSWAALGGIACLALLGLGSVVGVAFLWPSVHGKWPAMILALAWAIWGWAAWRETVARPNGTLRWDASVVDGEWTGAVGSWWWLPEGRAQPEAVGAIAQCLDWGHGMLIHGRIRRRGRWFWLRAADAKGQWGDLRRAIEAQVNPG